jgi:single-strand DNA-binding protein
MLSLNEVTLAGNVGSAPEIGFTASGVPIAKFSMAVSKWAKDREPRTFWFRCTAFGEKAKYVEEHVGKGASIWLRGELEPYEFTPEGATAKVTTYSVVVREIRPNMAPRPKDAAATGADAPGPQAAAPAPAGNGNGYKRQAPPPPPAQTGFNPCADLGDDVPF